MTESSSAGPAPGATGLRAGALRPGMTFPAEVAVPLDGVAYRYMFDASNGLSVPSGARMVAGYPWWPQADWDRFQKDQYGPGVLVVQNHSMDRGDVLDVEPGCEWPPGYAIGNWISARKEAGYFRPSVYCSAYVIPQIREFTGKWILNKDYSLWVAQWTGYPHDAYPGSSVTQYVDTGPYDISYVYDPGWPHRTAA